MENEHDTSVREDRRPMSSGWTFAFWILAVPLLLIFLLDWLFL